MRIMDTISALKKVMIMNRFLSATAFGIALIGFSTSGAMADTVLSTDPSSPTTLSFGDIGTFSNSNIPKNSSALSNNSDTYYFSISSSSSPINAYIYANSPSLGASGLSLLFEEFTSSDYNNSFPSAFTDIPSPSLVNGLEQVSLNTTLNPGDYYELTIGYDNPSSNDTAGYTGAVVTPIPESLPLFAAGLIGIWAWGRKSDKAATSI